ncbi:MAG TPA: haloacid dehalogenase type II [Chitinophagaceae bacterium]|jgi:2-haloacid dehalogenase|nr:haloacid dehalogenase type II [Chitinophagaceae bacterium]
MARYSDQAISRKAFIQMASLGAAGLLASSSGLITSNFKIKAIAFDAFAIFDPRPVFQTIHDLFPGNARQIIEAWQSKQFSYQWLRIAANKYKNFWDVTSDALDFAFQQSKITLRNKERDQIMVGYETLSAWSDVACALSAMRNEGFTICFLSNMTQDLLEQGIRNSNLNGLFDFVFSTDERQTYKPSPLAYQIAVDRLRLKKEEILFVPFAGWDMAGAKWFGFPTFWVNRSNALEEKLDVTPDGIGTHLDELITFIRNLK